MADSKKTTTKHDDDEPLSSSDVAGQPLTSEQKVELAENHPRPEDFDDEPAPAAVDRRPDADIHPAPAGMAEAPNQPGVLTPDQAGNPPA